MRKPETAQDAWGTHCGTHSALAAFMGLLGVGGIVLGVWRRGFRPVYGSRVITLKYILCVKWAPESALFYPTYPVEKEVN